MNVNPLDDVQNDYTPVKQLEETLTQIVPHVFKFRILKYKPIHKL